MMKNVKEVSERYEQGLVGINWGDKGYYEVNSDKPLKLNSYGGKDGWITNDKGEVEIFELLDVDVPCIYFLGDKQITKKEYADILDLIDNDYEEEERLGLHISHDNVKKWYGKTLDNYYPHPWYPNKGIKGFEIINNLPGTKKGDFFEMVNYWIHIPLVTGTAKYHFDDCLEYPEYFKPIYN